MAQRRLSEATKNRLKGGRMLLAGKGCAEVALAVGVERNEEAVRNWKRSTWPALKKKPSEKAA